MYGDRKAILFVNTSLSMPFSREHQDPRLQSDLSIHLIYRHSWYNDYTKSAPVQKCIEVYLIACMYLCSHLVTCVIFNLTIKLKQILIFFNLMAHDLGVNN